MKNSKPKIGEALAEALIEIVLAVICFGIGALVLHLFGVDFATMDGDTLILIGIVVFALLALIVCFVVKTIKKLVKRKDSNQNITDDNSTQQ